MCSAQTQGGGALEHRQWNQSGLVRTLFRPINTATIVHKTRGVSLSHWKHYIYRWQTSEELIVMMINFYGIYLGLTKGL